MKIIGEEKKNLQLSAHHAHVPEEIAALVNGDAVNLSAVRVKANQKLRAQTCQLRGKRQCGVESEPVAAEVQGAQHSVATYCGP